MSATLEDRVRSTIATVLNVAEDALREDAGPDTLAQWDSMNHLNVVLALESEFAVAFTDDDVTDMLSVGLICRIVNERVTQDRS
jgi:acyl carrier protein